MVLTWLLLLLAGLLEIGFVVLLGFSDGFTRPLPSIGVVVVAAASLWLLSLTMRRGLPAGTAYAVWVSIGALGSTAIGVLAFGDPATPLRLASIAVIAVAVIILQRTERPAANRPAKEAQ